MSSSSSQPHQPYGQSPHGGEFGPEPVVTVDGVPTMLMPASVSAARIVALALAGLCVVMSIVVGVLNGSQAGGAVLGASFLVLVVAGLAARYHAAGNGVRITSIVLLGVQIAAGLAAAAQGTPGGLIPLLGAVALVVLLSQSTAKSWFTRPFVSGRQGA